MRKIKWPDGKKFAFTIIDDTDGATVENVKPVYDYLFSRGIITTKTCWIYPSRDKYQGQTLSDEDYVDFLVDLKNKGYEIAFHNAGSGAFKREETISALDIFKDKFGEYPNIHINHANNKENIYWGKNRFKGIVKWIYSKKCSQINSEGDNPDSKYFWGDICKDKIKYIRNRTFNGLNTLKEDSRLVYRESDKQQFSNYWFSASDGMRLNSFCKLLKQKNIDKLVRNGGCSIVYTHFAYDFVSDDGSLNENFKKAIDYLAKQNGYFVPVSTLLEYALKDREYVPSKNYEKRQDLRWLIERLFKR